MIARSPCRALLVYRLLLSRYVASVELRSPLVHAIDAERCVLNCGHSAVHYCRHAISWTRLPYLVHSTVAAASLLVDDARGHGIQVSPSLCSAGAHRTSSDEHLCRSCTVSLIIGRRPTRHRERRRARVPDVRGSGADVSGAYHATGHECGDKSNCGIGVPCKKWECSRCMLTLCAVFCFCVTPEIPRGRAVHVTALPDAIRAIVSTSEAGCHVRQSDVSGFADRPPATLGHA